MAENKEYIYILDEDRFWMKVKFEDIYYIQTIKSTHYCEVILKTGKGMLHADIKPLKKELPEYFLKTRSSTLANMKLIKKVDLDNRLIYFDRSIFCSYTENVSSELKKLLHLYNYRSRRERT